VAMVADDEVSGSAARDVLGVLIAEGGDPAQVVEAQGLGRAGEDELEGIVERAIAENQDAVEKIKAGKGQAIGAIVGAVMRETKGRADGGEVQRLIRSKLGG
jgi:aspartyl-tRNA(Asn)/glutamyl-tRNA(Gln) amidotransferase subunit B